MNVVDTTSFVVDRLLEETFEAVVVSMKRLGPLVLSAPVVNCVVFIIGVTLLRVVTFEIGLRVMGIVDSEVVTAVTNGVEYFRSPAVDTKSLKT